MVGRSQSGPPAIGMAKPQSGPATTLTVQTQKQIATNSMPPGVRELVSGCVYLFHEPPIDQQIEVEIIFLHGLQLGEYKDAYWKTWRSRDGSTCWPTTWLSSKFPNARILSLSYDSSARKTAKTGNLDPTALGENLMNNLVSPQVRVGQKGCPIVFVCHSLGGLIAKEIVVGAANSANKDLQNLVKNIKAFFFYATPHQGSRLVEFGMMTKHLHVGLSDSVEYLQVLDKKRTRMDAKFHEQANKFNNEWKFYVVAETKETKVASFKGMMIVEEASACHVFTNCILHQGADHITVCKPDSTNDQGYQFLITCISEVINKYKLRLALEKK